METWKVKDQYKRGYDQSACKPETLYAFGAKITTDIYQISAVILAVINYNRYNVVKLQKLDMFVVK